MEECGIGTDCDNNKDNNDNDNNDDDNNDDDNNKMAMMMAIIATTSTNIFTLTTAVIMTK